MSQEESLYIQFDRLPDYNTDQNLFQNSIFSICQDEYGLIWLGSQTGLSRHDGIESEHYYHNSKEDRSIKGGHVTALCYINHALWVGTKEGLCQLSYDSQKGNFSIIRDTTHIEIKKICRINENDLLCISESYLLLYKNGKKIKIDLSKGGKINDVVYLNTANKFLVATDKGLLLAEENGGYLKLKLPVLPANPDAEITSLYKSEKSDIIYLGIGNYVYSGTMHDKSLRYRIEMILPKNTSPVTALLFDSRKWLWAGTRNSGLYILRNSYKKPIHCTREAYNRFSLSSNLILSLFESKDGVIWIGTNGGSVIKYADKRQQFFHCFAAPQIWEKMKKEYNNDVWAIFAKNEKIFLGTDGMGIAVYDSVELLRHNKDIVRNWITYENGGFDYNVVTTISNYSNSKDSILIGTLKGLYKISIRDKSKTFGHRNKVTDFDSISVIYSYQNGYAVGSVNKGLMLLDGHLKVLRKINFPSKINAVSGYCSDNKLLIATGTGLYEMNLTDGDYNNNFFQNLGNKNIQSVLFECSDNTLWAGVFGEGLYYKNKQTGDTKTYNQKTKIKDNVIYGVLKDKYEDIWVSTNNGLSRINKKQGYINHYSTEHGVQDKEFNTGAYRRFGEILFFGGVNGLTWFMPAVMRSNLPDSSLIYRFQSSADEGLSLSRQDREVDLSNDARVVNITFCTPDYHDPANNEYFIEIKGANGETDTSFSLLLNDLLIHERLGDNYRLQNGINKMTAEWRKSFENRTMKQRRNIQLRVLSSEGHILEIIRWVFILLSVILLITLYKSDKRKTDIASELNKKNVQLDKTNEELQRKSEFFDKLKNINHAIARLDKPKEIFDLAVLHLCDENYFDFDYAVIFKIDKHSSSIESNYSYKCRPIIVPPPDEWRNKEKGNLSLGEEDILNVVFNNRDIVVKVKCKEVEIVRSLSQNAGIQLDTTIYEENDHQSLIRVFLPIVRRSGEKSGMQEGDFTFGVLEAGHHLSTNKEIGEDKIQNLILYIDHCAQAYHKALLEENTIKNKEITLQYYYENNPTVYLEKTLKTLTKKFECDWADIALVNYDETPDEWIPKDNECIVYNIEKQLLEKTRKKSKGRASSEGKGIYRLVLETGQYYYTGDINSDKYYIHGLPDVASQLSVPLSSYEKMLGTLNLYSSKQYFFDEYKAKNIQVLSDEIADIFHRKKANFILGKLAPPADILLEEYPIYREMIDRAKEYFQSKYVDILTYEKRILVRRISYPEAINFVLPEDFVPPHNMEIFQFALFPETVRSIIPGESGFQSAIVAPVVKGKNRTSYMVILCKRKLTRLFPEDQIFLTQAITKYDLSLKNTKIFETFYQVSQPLAEGKPEEIFKSIVDAAKNIFDADVALLFRIIVEGPVNTALVYFSGKLVHRLGEEGGQFESINNNVVNIVAEIGSLFAENESQYLASPFNFEKRNWQSRIWKTDFYHREDIRAFAAIRLGPKEEPRGVLFVNFRKEDKKFNDDFKILFNTFARLSDQAMLHATYQKENTAFKEKNIQLTKPFIESAIISGIAHNTGNLISSLLRRYNEIRNEVQSLKGEQVPKRLVNEHLDLIKDGLDSLNTDFLKLQAFRKSVDKAYIDKADVSQMIRHVYDLIRNRATQKKIHIDIKLSGAKYEIACDKNYIEHALLNILINAIDAFDGSPGRIVIHVLSEKNKTVTIRISDNGPGIKREHFGKIFEPYFTTKKDGTGIGLPTVKYIVEEIHNGRVDFYSQYKKGSTFEFVLPIEQPKPSTNKN